MGPTEIQPDTMKVEDAAQRLGIGRQTAYDLAHQGKVPGARRLGRRIVVSRVALEAFLSADGPNTQTDFDQEG